EVVVCAGHMLNNAQAPDVCRFLGDLRHDGRAQFASFDWGPASGLPFLPRVQQRRIVLSPAQWRVDARARAELSTGPASSFMARLPGWRARWQVPRYVYLSFGDNRLLLDLDDQAQADELQTEIRQLADGAQILLQEALPAPDEAWAVGPGGCFFSELVVPLVLRADERSPAAAALQPRPLDAAATAERLRLPGSDWLFAKLYGPRALEDDLLTGPVAELCQRILEMRAADDWFFIRYSD